MMPDDPTLAAILDGAWLALTEGCANPDHGFHWPVLATRGLDDAADARTVVLRAVSPDRRELRIHTDTQAAKLDQLQADARCCLVFHHGPIRTQLRAYGRATVHRLDALSLDDWSALPARSQALYAGPQRFAVLVVRLTRLDWLLLDPAGHRRAGFHWSDTGLQATWLNP